MPPSAWLQWFTDLADQSIVLPLMGLVATVLLLHSRRAAAAWTISTGGVLLVMLLLKLAFGACAARFGFAGVASPSGHTASGTVVYGRLLPLLIPPLRAGRPWVVAVILAALFGTSRVLLHDHSVAEAALGGTIGVAGATLFRSAAGLDAATRGLTWKIAVACLLPLALLHGHRLTVEARIHSFAADWLRARACPLPAEAMVRQRPAS